MAIVFFVFYQTFLTRSDTVNGNVKFYLGKEAVPRHRLQALLAGGEFDRALELARAHSMDETDVHAARLLSLLREGGGGSRAGGVGITGEGDGRTARVQPTNDRAMGLRSLLGVRALLWY